MMLSLPASSQSQRPVKPPHKGKQRECGANGVIMPCLDPRGSSS